MWLLLILVVVASALVFHRLNRVTPASLPEAMPVVLVTPPVESLPLAPSEPPLVQDPLPDAPAENAQQNVPPPDAAPAVTAIAPALEEPEPEPATPRPTLDLSLRPHTTNTPTSSATPYSATMNNSDMRAPRIDARMTRQFVAPAADQPYLNPHGELERRISRDCVLTQRIMKLPIGNDELVTHTAFCLPRGDEKLKRDFDAMAERRARALPE